MKNLEVEAKNKTFDYKTHKFIPSQMFISNPQTHSVVVGVVFFHYLFFIFLGWLLFWCGAVLIRHRFRR